MGGALHLLHPLRHSQQKLVTALCFQHLCGIMGRTVGPAGDHGDSATSQAPNSDTTTELLSLFLTFWWQLFRCMADCNWCIVPWLPATGTSLAGRYAATHKSTRLPRHKQRVPILQIWKYALLTYVHYLEIRQATRIAMPLPAGTGQCECFARVHR